MHRTKGPLGNKVNRSKRFTVPPNIVTTIDHRAGAAWSMHAHAASCRGIVVISSDDVSIYSVVPWGWQWHAREQCVSTESWDGRHHVDGSEMHPRALIGSCGRLPSTATTVDVMIGLRDCCRQSLNGCRLLASNGTAEPRHSSSCARYVAQQHGPLSTKSSQQPLPRAPHG